MKGAEVVAGRTRPAGATSAIARGLLPLCSSPSGCSALLGVLWAVPSALARRCARDCSILCITRRALLACMREVTGLESLSASLSSLDILILRGGPCGPWLDVRSTGR